MKYAVYAKGIIAAVGLALTGALSLFAPHTTTWDVLTVIVIVAGAVGTVAVPNADPAPAAPAPTK